ncbi:MAG: phosphotransferase [bacterium]|nr:phosphotransferase [bacterium]
MAQKPSLQIAALATSAVRGLEIVATRAPQFATTDYRYCGLLDARGRHWIAQAALHPAASTALDAEVPILDQLDIALREDRIGFDVMRPEGTTELPTGHRMVVYRELPGKPLELATLHAGPGPAAELGRAIAEIHELPAALLDAAHAPVYDADSYRRRRLAELDDAARTSKVPPILLARWERALEDVALWHFHAVPTHGDLAAENVHLSNGTVAAILNWSNAHVGDPAADLAWLYAAAPEESLDTIDEAYAMGRSLPPDEHMGARATLYSELAVARWLLHGVRLDDQEIIADAEVMLHALARQVADSGPIGRAELVVEEIDWVEASAGSSWSVSGTLSPLSPDDDARLPSAPGTSPVGSPGDGMDVTDEIPAVGNATDGAGSPRTPGTESAGSPRTPGTPGTAGTPGSAGTPQ